MPAPDPDPTPDIYPIPGSLYALLAEIDDREFDPVLLFLSPDGGTPRDAGTLMHDLDTETLDRTAVRTAEGDIAFASADGSAVLPPAFRVIQPTCS